MYVGGQKSINATAPGRTAGRRFRSFPQQSSVNLPDRAPAADVRPHGRSGQECTMCDDAHERGLNPLTACYRYWMIAFAVTGTKLRQGRLAIRMRMARSCQPDLVDLYQ